MNSQIINSEGFAACFLERGREWAQKQFSRGD